MCGIVGLVSESQVNQSLYDALTILQHRGQDAAGIVTSHHGKLFLRKSNGLVRDVFRKNHMKRLVGNMGIGHVRYPTAGCSSSAESQPFYVNSPYGITLAHNGNLINVEELSEEIFKQDLRHINTTSDSEVLLNVFAHELHVLRKYKPTHEEVFTAVRKLHQRCKGAYAAVGMITGYGLFAFRDPKGIRPLIFGKKQGKKGKTEYMVASESVALDVLGFEVIRDVAPGEAIYIDQHGELHTRQCSDNASLNPCIFEHVYLARPDSFIDKISVYKARLRMGEKLAEKILRVLPNHDIDVVIPIPDSGRVSSLPLAHRLNVKYREGFIKNRYIGRTFIMPGQQVRKKSVKQKLNPIGLEFKDKNVLLVDDSIVRGTTCKEIIQMARDAGAKKVYLASSAPAVKFPNVYGIDMPSPTELIAHGRTDQEVCKLVGADLLIYQDLKDLIDCAREGNPEITQFDCSVFDGHYVTQDVEQSYLTRIDAMRSDDAKNENENHDSHLGFDAMIDLHNDS